jgi:molybdate transport system substrate-binding protein
MKRLPLWLALTMLLAGAAAQAAEVLVFAAASLNDALQDIRVRYEAGQEDRIAYNFEASSKLARQIIAGAPADIFFSADEEKMDQLQAKGLIVEGTRASVLSNTLVLVTAPDDTRVETPRDLLKPGITRLALAQPDTVPAGIYAKAYLRGQDLWSGVSDRVIPTENVRAALAAVESGNADAAFVYRTDVRAQSKVRVAYEVPPADVPPITYPVALIKGTKNDAAARRFLAYLRSEVAAAAFRRQGFQVLPAP